ncbi:hypothetical protein DFJ63DRAFT_311698 [Scheffersomyces coipomensis]|uniref:uncharacterized protein n=1 Tax=Scheffersomyces coipomensis TaxID=1788519 RepID=UPI00315C4E29
MVAEPVQATIETLSYLYNKTNDFINTQHGNVSISDLYDQITSYNPFNHDLTITIHQNTNHNRKITSPIKEKFAQSFVEHKWKYISILTVGLGVGTYVFYQQVYKPVLLIENANNNNNKLKRRVPKLSNGARGDVVLIIGSPTEPLTRLIALDFEKRGFIVYLTILDEKDFKYVESNPITDDINYLNLNESVSFESQLIKFQQLLELAVIPFPGAESHNLTLKAIVFSPQLYFPIGPIENVMISTWSKLQDKMFIYLKLFSSGLINLARLQSSKIILIYPNIISSLSIPYHSPETLFQTQLKSLFTILTREVSQHNLSVTQVKLGNLNISNQRSNTSQRTTALINSEIKNWNEDIKSLYADNFSKSQYKSNPIKSSGGGKGTSLRELYHILFDLIYTPPNRRNPSIVYCGTGARSYDIISGLIPESWIEWILR